MVLTNVESRSNVLISCTLKTHARLNISSSQNNISVSTLRMLSTNRVPIKMGKSHFSLFEDTIKSVHQDHIFKSNIKQRTFLFSFICDQERIQYKYDINNTNLSLIYSKI